MCLQADPALGQWSTSSLSQGRCCLSAASVGTKALFAGGIIHGANQPTPVVDIYDVPTGTWSLALLSQPTASMAATTLGDRVFFAGGDLGTNLMTGLPEATAVVHIYDDSNGTWSTDTLSEARWGICAVTVGDKVMFAGGLRDNSGSGISGTVDIYDRVTGTWSVASLSVPRAGIQGSSCGALALFGGGISAGGLSDVVDVFDSTTGLWSTETLPTTSGIVAATAVPLNVYASPGAASMQELEEAGISRLSLGPGLIKAVLRTMKTVALGLKTYESYDVFTDNAMQTPEILEFVRKERES